MKNGRPVKTGERWKGEKTMDLRALGRETARGTILNGRSSGRREAAGLRRGLKKIEEVRQRLGQRSWDRLPTAVEWLLDNAYLIRREGMAAQEELRRGKRLRIVGETSYLGIAAQAFALKAPAMHKEDLACFLEGLQREQPLTEEELSLFLPALKKALCLQMLKLCPILEEFPEKPGLAESVEEIFVGLRALSTSHFGPLIEQSSPV